MVKKNEYANIHSNSYTTMHKPILFGVPIMFHFPNPFSFKWTGNLHYPDDLPPMAKGQSDPTRSPKQQDRRRLSPLQGNWRVSNLGQGALLTILPPFTNRISVRAAIESARAEFSSVRSSARKITHQLKSSSSRA